MSTTKNADRLSFESDSDTTVGLRSKRSSFGESVTTDTESELSDGPDTSLKRQASLVSTRTSEKHDPLASIRYQSIVVQLVAAGLSSTGSAVLIVLYCTGLPHNSNWTDATGAVVLLLLVFGCAATIPSWTAASLLIWSRAKHPRALRACALIALLLATIYASLGLISWVLLQNKDSFRDFCLLNEPELTAEQCVSRWNRQWAVLLAVALCFIYHITIGFSVYRFTQKSTNPA